MCHSWFPYLLIFFSGRRNIIRVFPLSYICSWQYLVHSYGQWNIESDTLIIFTQPPWDEQGARPAFNMHKYVVLCHKPYTASSLHGIWGKVYGLIGHLGQSKSTHLISASFYWPYDCFHVVHCSVMEGRQQGDPPPAIFRGGPNKNHA